MYPTEPFIFSEKLEKLFRSKRKKSILENQQNFSKIYSKWLETFYKWKNFDATNFFGQNTTAQDPLIIDKKWDFWSWSPLRTRAEFWGVFCRWLRGQSDSFLLGRYLPELLLPSGAERQSPRFWKLTQTREVSNQANSNPLAGPIGGNRQ